MARARRQLAAAGALGCVIAALSAQPAIALIPVETRTPVTVASTGPTTATYSGKVRTFLKKGKLDRQKRRALRNCLRGRRVSIDYLGRSIGETVTDSSGNWTISGSKPSPGGEVDVLVSRDVRGGVLCGVILVTSTAIS